MLHLCETAPPDPDERKAMAAILCIIHNLDSREQIRTERGVRGSFEANAAFSPRVKRD